MRSSSDLVRTFAWLIENEFRSAPVAMWNEVFSGWAGAKSRVDDDSKRQFAEYEKFLRESVRHLREIRDDQHSGRDSDAAATVLEQIFGHVAQLISFAEGRAASGMRPRNAESAVLNREVLVELLSDEVDALLADAVQRKSQ